MADTWNALFPGNSAAQLDPTEGNATSENASALVGIAFGSSDSPLSEELVSITTADNGGATSLDVDNNTNNDTVQFNLNHGAGDQTNALDAVVVYDATLTFKDGSIANISAVIFQDVNGNLFLAPEISANADSAAMESQAIESITINSIIEDTSNLFQSRLLTEFVCFASGTSILTPSGHQRIETLRPGDLVETLDRGPRPILWHGTRHLDFATADATQKPIEIKQGALGPAMPERRLAVSPQHRVLLHTPNGQALAIAKGLLQAPGVRRMAGRRTARP